MKAFLYALVAFLAQMPMYFPASHWAVKLGALAIGVGAILHAYYADSSKGGGNA